MVWWGLFKRSCFFPRLLKRIVSVSTPTTIATKKENDTSMYISKIIHCTINPSFFLKLRLPGYSHIPLAATDINNCRYLHRRKRLHMYVLAQDTFIHPYLHTYIQQTYILQRGFLFRIHVHQSSFFLKLRFHCHSQYSHIPAQHIQVKRNRYLRALESTRILAMDLHRSCS